MTFLERSYSDDELIRSYRDSLESVLSTLFKLMLLVLRGVMREGREVLVVVAGREGREERLNLGEEAISRLDAKDALRAEKDP